MVLWCTIRMDDGLMMKSCGDPYWFRYMVRSNNDVKNAYNTIFLQLLKLYRCDVSDLLAQCLWSLIHIGSQITGVVTF